MTAHIELRFSQMGKEYQGAYVGRQQLNSNSIDIIVGPGDYQLKLTQFNTHETPCAMYAFEAVLNPLSSMLLSAPL